MDPNQAPFALEHQLISSLIRNRQTTDIWQKRKAEHETLKGTKAMMKAELIHTNEITVSLGVGWFVKVSAKDAMEICERRIAECDEMLKKCETERTLYESRRDAKLRNEAFGGKEIMEKFDEKEEEKWRNEHRKKVQKHKKELAEVRDKVKQTTTETEEDLWKLLDMLELREELEDEISRLGEDDEETDESEEEDDESEESEGEEYHTGESGLEGPPVDKKRVRFGLDPVAEVHEAPEPVHNDPKLVKTTAVKDEISETKTSVGGNVQKSTRPASKFKKTRQGGGE